LDQFKAWKQYGIDIPAWIPAKLADALLLLNHELKQEGQHGETQKQQQLQQKKYE
jgi:hypothetical protein